jgi:hypothetical protein
MGLSCSKSLILQGESALRISDRRAGMPDPAKTTI